MSAEAENPYFVESHFQSDNRFTQWLAKKREVYAKPETKNTTRSNRDKHTRMFDLMKQLHEKWTHDFHKAAQTSYECYYFRDNALNHGWSQVKNDNIPMSDILMVDPHKYPNRTCYMHEVGLKNGPMRKMFVPLYNMNVLWRMRDQ